MKADETRQRILAAARSGFAASGYRATSVRSIATAAGVDQALVHHYFGTKHELFVASTQLPFDPARIAGMLTIVPVENLGHRLVTMLLEMIDGEHQEAYLAAIRTLLVSETGVEGMGEFLAEIVFGQLASRVDRPVGAGRLRMALVGTQIGGLLMARYLGRVEPVASLSAADVADLVGPVVQHYLTGELGGREGIAPLRG